MNQTQEMFSALLRFNGLLLKLEPLRQRDVIGQIETVQPAHPADQKKNKKQQPGPLDLRHLFHHHIFNFKYFALSLSRDGRSFEIVFFLPGEDSIP